MIKASEWIKNHQSGLPENKNGVRLEKIRPMKKSEEIKCYPVWDLGVRLFHWINVLCVMSLIAVGIVILNSKSLGITNDGKIILKTLHVYIGYVFAVNLGWRFIRGFFGGKYARWKAILPLGKKYKALLSAWIKGEKTHNPPNFLGHNPIARLMVTLLFLLLSVQTITGLVLAGTDLYMPPFGHEIAKWVSDAPADGSKSLELKPYSKVNVNPESYKEMRAFRKPFIKTHVFVFYTLLAAILFHVAGVVFTEVKEKSGLISAMFTGNKFFSKKPIDMVDDE